MVDMAMAAMAICVFFAFLAMAAALVTMSLIVYRRFGQNEPQIADEIASRIIDAFNSGADMRKAMQQDVEANIRVEAETRVRRQFYRQQDSPQRQDPPDRPVEIAVFGEAPYMPEMHTDGVSD